MTPSYYYNDVKPWQRLPDPAFTNFEPEDFLEAQRQAANWLAEQRLRRLAAAREHAATLEAGILAQDRLREARAAYIAAMLSCRVDAAIDANTSDLRPVQRDYVSAAQRDQARLRAVDVV